MRQKLTNDNINIACGEAGEFLKGRSCASKEVLRVTFSLEEVLLNYQRMLGPDAEFIMDTGSGLGRSRIRITVPGEETDPYADIGSFSDEDTFIRNALNQMGRLPRWSYRRGANVILFTTDRKKMPEWMKLCIAIATAVLFGLAIRLLPADIGALIRDGIVAPLISTFLGFLNAVAGPMIFLAVVWGIYSIGDAATFSEVGKRLSRNAAVLLVAMTSAVALITMPLFRLNYSGGKAGGDFSSLYQMVLDIIPSNLFTPFSRGNTLQILFVAVIVGIAMLLIGKNTQAVAELAEQLGFIVNGIMNVISSLVPAFVFGSLFTIVASSDFGRLASGGKFFIVSAAGCALLLIMHTACTCLRCRISPAMLWKAAMSTFVIAITTASSSAAFSDNLHTCTDKLGISSRLANFGVPFGQILYKPGVAVLFWFSAVSTAESEHIDASLTWIITALFMCIVLSAAAPPVPGGMSASFTILFAQLGLPAASIAIILSLTSILDFLVTGTNIFSGQCLLRMTSESYGKGRQ